MDHQHSQSRPYSTHLSALNSDFKDIMTTTHTRDGSLHTGSTAFTTTSSVKTTRGKKPAQPDPPKTLPGAPRNNRGERMTFELDDVLRKYSPEQYKTCKAYDVGGVNILNKKLVDSRTALDKIKRRRETHNRVERRRRDCINQLILELTSLLPGEVVSTQAKCHRVNVLRATVAHIQTLTRDNEVLKRKFEAIHTDRVVPPPAIMPTPALMAEHGDRQEDAVPFKSDPTPAMTYTLQASPHTNTTHTPFKSPPEPPGHGTQPEWRTSTTHLPHMTLPGPRTEHLFSSHAHVAPSASHSGIPMIVEPSDSVPEIPNAKRLNRHTLPKLQLIPPPFHQHAHYQHHCSSGGESCGTGCVQHAPSCYSQDSSTSPNSAHSGSSATWFSPHGPPSSSLSATSSGFGGTSPRTPSSLSYGPPSPYSPYGPSSAHAHMSRSPGLAPWGAYGSGSSGTRPLSTGMSSQSSGKGSHAHGQQQPWQDARSGP